MSKLTDLPAYDVDEMTDDEIRLMIARDNLKRYGSTLPPEGAPPVVVIVRTSEPRPKFDRRKVRRVPGDAGRWGDVWKTCPRCHHSKPVVPDFGVIKVKGKEYPNGWCKLCRSEASADYKRNPRSR